MKSLLAKYAPLFKKLRPLAIHYVDCGDNWYGLFVPGFGTDVILVNVHHCTTRDLRRATLLHELIHAEQHALGRSLSHGRYFKKRAREIRRATNLTP